MKHFSRKRLLAIAIALAACLSLFVVCSGWNQRNMLRVTREWGRLAPLPASAQQFTIRMEGSMFTRAFRASFVAPLADIDRWLGESPGTRDIVPTHPSPTTRHFVIAPGGGAQWAEVTIDDERGSVNIYVYWS